MSLRVLTEDDLRSFEENGYLRVPNVIPKADCDAVIDALFDNLGMDRNNPEDWYRPPLTPGGMIEMYQHPAMWNNRQNPKLHSVFADLLGTEKLWVTIDRVNLKPPFRDDRPQYDHKGFMHWDADITRAAHGPLRVQGVLYLADTGENMGGFQCAPGHHKIVREWAKNIEPGSKERPDMSGVPILPIYGNTGDLVIWNNLLYHGNGRNLSDRPRLAQYISMFPAGSGAEWGSHRDDRIRRWRERLPPNAPWAPGDPRRQEELHGTTAELTPLGRKLLGLDLWD
ncbi:MAG: phytanoyl-CoA dioxygenase family protein [Capsulimonadales bacterium]|nr:phytanoyl-CoA dioxygenase family protein [Capsulimonadales bacterium]